jgi:hypothetical protein
MHRALGMQRTRTGWLVPAVCLGLLWHSSKVGGRVAALFFFSKNFEVLSP